MTTVPLYGTIVSDMNTILFPSKELFRLLELFFSNPTSKFYLREIQRLLDKPVGSIQRHLTQLEHEGVFTTKREGPLKYFSLNQDYPYFSELKSIVLREIRLKELEKNLKKIVRKLKKNYKPQKLILFGSLAKGRVSPESDIDLLIVKEKVPKRYPDRIKEIAHLLIDSNVGIDFIIWTPEELTRETDQNLFLKEEILKKGKVLYERAA